MSGPVSDDGSGEESAYDRVRAAYGGERPTVTAFPDGSVDEFCELYDGASGERIGERDSFAEAVSRGAASFRRRTVAREAGGQAVNMARQAAAFDAETTLIGFLDHPLLSTLPFETISLGEPSRVSVYRFDGEPLVVAEESEAIENWEPADLAAAAGDRFPSLLRADAVCCGNWVSFRDLPAAFRDAAARIDEGGAFVFDPGGVAGAATDELVTLFDALRTLDGSYDVVVSGNRREIEYLASVADEQDGRNTGRSGGNGADAGTEDDTGGGRADEGSRSDGASGDGGSGGDAAALRRVRDAVGVTGVVLHEQEKAAAAAPEGVVEVPNLDTPTEKRTTGAGDRFSAGLAYALGSGWEWDVALALGNACASHYVETGTTLTGASLDGYLAERSPVG